MTNELLVAQLIDQGVLKTPALIDAFRAIDRATFVPASLHDQAYDNHPLPIGHGQTISQPYTVAFMLELLQPQPGHNIMDIGSGSGWQTALLAHLVGPTGHVTALEIKPELAHQSIRHLAPYNFINQGIVDILSHSAKNGAPDRAPFDRIIAAAEVKAVPQAWLEQLQIGGRLVTPQHNSLLVINKQAPDNFTQQTIPGFVFVPFIST